MIEHSLDKAWNCGENVQKDSLQKQATVLFCFADTICLGSLSALLNHPQFLPSRLPLSFFPFCSRAVQHLVHVAWLGLKAATVGISAVHLTDARATFLLQSVVNVTAQSIVGCSCNCTLQSRFWLGRRDEPSCKRAGRGCFREKLALVQQEER